MTPCDRCKALEARVKAMSERVKKSRPDVFGDGLRRRAYRNLLSSINEHAEKTDHEIDSVSVIVAFGKRSVAK